MLQGMSIVHDLLLFQLFVTIYLFEVIRGNLALAFPRAIEYLAKAWISCKRIQVNPSVALNSIEW